MACTVVASDDRPESEIDALPIDVARWADLAERSANDEGGFGELTLTFVDRDEIARLNAQFMGVDGPTDVLSFPLDDAPTPGVPSLLGDIVVSPTVAASQYPGHAGTFDDEIALLVVHGVLHVLGHDHAEPDETAVMREREVVLLIAHHWGEQPPARFRQTHTP